MRLRFWSIIPAAGAALLIGGAAKTPILAFGRMQPGQWQLRSLDNSEPPSRLCIADGTELIQLRHPGAGCSRFVLTNDPQTATVHYTCTGAGYGRTTVTVETPQLVRIESQGLANQAPFQMSLEGRRIGDCTQGHAAR